MGIVRMGPPEEVVLRLKRMANAEIFVETGTYRGDTARWASRFFKRVYTIENSQDMYNIASERLKHVENIKMLQGDTREELPIVLEDFTGAGIFWLDAHWSGGSTYGLGDECPILEEVKCLLNNENINRNHIIIIDDARLFMAPPPLPHDRNHWPDLPMLITTIQKLMDNKCGIYIVEDVMIIVPEIYKSSTSAMLQQYLTPKQ